MLVYQREIPVMIGWVLHFCWLNPPFLLMVLVVEPGIFCSQGRHHFFTRQIVEVKFRP